MRSASSVLAVAISARCWGELEHHSSRLTWEWLNTTSLSSINENFSPPSSSARSLPFPLPLLSRCADLAPHT